MSLQDPNIHQPYTQAHFFLPVHGRTSIRKSLGTRLNIRMLLYKP